MPKIIKYILNKQLKTQKITKNITIKQLFCRFLILVN